jgi:hypothetical protein
MSEGKATCPICGKPSLADVQPFCSREEFRTPLGVRKSARNEPAGRRL